MSFHKNRLKDANLHNKTVLLRVDFNVPINPDTNQITDITRIKYSLPTIKYLMESNAKTVIGCHIGRPKGQYREEMSVKIVAEILSHMLKIPIEVTQDSTSQKTKSQIFNMKNGELLMLENLRFNPEEEANDTEFARELARGFDLFVNDAFGVSHRAHASVDAISQFLPTVSGMLLEQEVDVLTNLLNKPDRPFTTILGGAKISDKIKVVENLGGIADHILIGGGMAATFLKGQGMQIGKSIVDPNFVESVKSIFNQNILSSKLHIPTDVVVAEEFNKSSQFREIPVSEIKPSEIILDIGTNTLQKYRDIIRNSATVFWNGPMGIYEWKSFEKGTREIAKTLSNEAITSIIGGGSTVDAINHFKVANKITHISTGGGASLEFLGGKILPGIKYLLSKEIG
jgi:phosphoglycerate kinase